VILLLAVLWRADPVQVRLYPGCPFLALTHLYCPGCGGIRALHALIHGRIADAARYNVFLLLSLPLAAVVLYRRRRGAGIRALLTIMIPWGVALVLFWVARNLPGYPFALLAP